MTVKDVDGRVAELVSHLKSRFPAGVPRCRVGEASGGLISPKTMANLAAATGEMPEGTIKVRGKVVYPVEAFVSWLYGKEKIDND